jgi:hypothetical protein
MDRIGVCGLAWWKGTILMAEPSRTNACLDFDVGYSDLLPEIISVQTIPTYVSPNFLHF